MIRNLRPAVYLLAFAVPVAGLLWLQYESIIRQRKAVRDLTTANLLFSGERLAAVIEQMYYAGAEGLLERYEVALQQQRQIHPLPPREFKRVLESLRSTEMFDQVFIINRDRSVSSACEDTRGLHANLPLRILPLLRSHEPGKVLPLAIQGAEAAQFLYSETASGQYLIASVNLRTALADRRGNASVLGIHDHVRTLWATETPKADEAVIRFPTLFPFWRLALSPADDRGGGESDILIFAVLTSALLMAFGFSVVLQTRVNWRRWRSSQVREEFLQDVSHDLRNPVNNILLYSELLISTNTASEDGSEWQEIIHREAQRLVQLLERVLDVSKAKRAAQSLHLVWCEVRPILDEAIETAARGARSGAVQIEVKAPSLLPQVHCDRSALVQCLVNLLDNALKYSGDSPQIEVEMSVRQTAVEIAVRDEGIGIPQNEIPRIFDEFYRASNARSASGYGLGLSLVKAIVDAHHAHIEVTSRPHQGTEFRLILPLGHADDRDCRR